MTGQNATEDKPTNHTRDALARQALTVHEQKLWVQWARGFGKDSILRFLPDAARAAVDTEWRGLDRVTVRREDWERYEAMGTVSRNPAMLPDSLGGGLNFISLGELVGVGVEIEKRKSTTPPQSAQETEFREIAAFSNTAWALHQAFHNARAKGNTVPGWVEVNKQTGKPVYNDAVTDEGMEMLTYICGWRDRNRRETIQNAKGRAAAEKAGIPPDQIADAHDPRGGAYKDFFRAREIGFDRDDGQAIRGRRQGGCRAAEQAQ